MMTQMQALFFDSQAIAQFKLEQYVQGQALAVAPEDGANYSLQSSLPSLFSIPYLHRLYSKLLVFHPP